jgi:signal transduction histidine kinase
VAGGLAERTGFDPTLVRIVFVVLALVSGFGLIAYVVGWLLLPAAGVDRSIGIRAVSDGRGIALALSVVPVLIVVELVASALDAGVVASAAGPVLLSIGGLVLVYRNADPEERAWLRRVVEPLARLGSVRRHSLGGSVLRIALGLALALAGIALLVVGHPNPTAWRALAGALLVMVAVVVIFGPWWLRLARDLVLERQARVRAEERADMAARVHDSVLQTLALIQRSADQPQRVIQLARAQERDLRSWLFSDRPAVGAAPAKVATLADGVARIAAEIEADHGISVDAVTVGDVTLDDDLTALLAAGREATLNAAKWSGAPTIAVFVEAEPRSVSMFIRDRGVGFDPASVPAGRGGLAESVLGRMTRHGGTARIRSELGEGTEVELTMPIRPRR